MKRLLIYFLFIGLSSCCTKKKCSSAFDTQEVTLIGFDSQDVDSIYVTSYLKGTNFLVDSSYTTGRRRFPDDNVFIVFMPIELTDTYDYRFEFNRIGRTYEITEIKTEMKKCNTCFLTSDKYESLTEYEVNGETTYYGAFEIKK